MDNFNRDEVKEEVLKVGKWARLFFMFVYAFVLNFALTISLAISFIQFLFFLFTSKINAALFDFNKHILTFFDDTLKFLLFETEDKPFPFNKSSDSSEDNAPEIVEAEAEVVEEEVVEAEIEVVEEEVVEAEVIAEDSVNEEEPATETDTSEKNTTS